MSQSATGKPYTPTRECHFRNFCITYVLKKFVFVCDQLQHGTYYCEIANCTAPGAAVVYTCDDGYESTTGLQNIMLWCDGGKWSGTPGTCGKSYP